MLAKNVLRSVTRRPVTMLRSGAAITRITAIRSLAVDGNWEKRERAAEAAYFTKLERDQLKAMLEKIESSTSQEHQIAAKDGLAKILKQHKIAETDALLHDLHVWRYGDESYLKKK